MDDPFTHQHNFPRYQLKTPNSIEVIDGRHISSSDITEYVQIDCTIGNHHEKRIAYVASIGHYPIMLGIPWSKKHDVSINFRKLDIQFRSRTFLAQPSKITPTPIKGITMARKDKIYAISTTSLCRIVNNENNRYRQVE
jgi:hypothetical protein